VRTTVTIAIPAYNSENYIIQALISVLQQTYKVDEILVVDDCSKDSSINAINVFIEKNKNHKINLIKNEVNLGYQKNWNKCLELATSDYVLLLHSDDMLKPYAIEKQMRYFKEHPEVALVGGYEDFIDERGNLKRENEPKETNIYNTGQIFEFVTNHNSYIACSSVLFNMEKINHVGFFDENVLGTDELYWPRVLTKYPIAVLGESLINRRIHSGQTEYSDFNKNFYSIITAGYTQMEVIFEYEKRAEFKIKIKNILKLKFSLSLLKISKYVTNSGNYPLGFKYFIYSFKFYPLIPFRKTFWKTIAHIVLDPLLIKINH